VAAAAAVPALPPLAFAFLATAIACGAVVALRGAVERANQQLRPARANNRPAFFRFCERRRVTKGSPIRQTLLRIAP